MSILGGVSKEKIVTHAALSLATVGGMWCIFTYGLEVILPQGMIFSAF
jgi:putative tricarboxylic transport membrane protein